MLYLINDNKSYNRYFNKNYKYQLKTHLNNRKLKYMIGGEFFP